MLRTTDSTTIHDGPTLEELFRRFGPMPARRIRLEHYPATEQDVLDVDVHEDRHCDLIDGLLVEKTVGLVKAYVAAKLSFLVGNFVHSDDLGVITGSGGTMRLRPGLVRAPDVAFTRWEQFPTRKIPRTPIISIYPDLAAEVLSEGNTDKEMETKRNEYFDAGTRLVWIIDPDARTLAAYTPESRHTTTIYQETDTVKGDPVLPGFELLVGKLFEKLAGR